MALLLALVASTVMATAATPPPKAPDDFKMGVQAWTFNRFTAFEAIAMTAQAGGKYMEFYPGQKLKPGSDVTVGPDMGAEATSEFKAQLDKFGITPVAFGVTGISADPAKARPLFQWAKGLGLLVINTESTEALDTIESMVKEFDIKVGIHNHPKRANDPNYKVWDPAYVLSLVKNRDHRIGSCADTGHWVRSGIRPIDALRLLKGRIMCSHLKDLNEFSPSGHDVPYGLGISDIPAILNEFKAQGFHGPASVEYEYNEEHSLPEVAACLGFVRGYFAPKR
jgi:sugar phosphate isomerase/epimerase